MPSSVIRRFRYDEAERRLRVTFVSGDVYDYDGVPPEVVAEFRGAGSKGQFFASDIRDRYSYRRVARHRPSPLAGEGSVGEADQPTGGSRNETDEGSR